MDKLERAMFAAVERNYDYRTLTEKLRAISARRRKERETRKSHKVK